MWRFVGKTLGILTVLLLITGPLAYAIYFESETRNFRPVREGVLYRSGQMNLRGLKRVINDYGIRTVITLRDAHAPGESPPDRQEEEFCKKMELNYHRIPPRRWEGSHGGPAPVEPGVQKFIRILADRRNHPVLIHCFAGVHRTGAYTAIYRMEFEGWSNDEAIAELKTMGYSNIDDHLDILGYMERFQPTWRSKKEGLGIRD